jgi:hypothetical protein
VFRWDLQVTGITGPVVRIGTYLLMEIDDARRIRAINLYNPPTASAAGVAALYDESQGELTGTELGIDCGPNATAFDDASTRGPVAGASPPYAGTFLPITSISELAVSRPVSDVNGRWTLEIPLDTARRIDTLCWILWIDWQPPA